MPKMRKAWRKNIAKECIWLNDENLRRRAPHKSDLWHMRSEHHRKSSHKYDTNAAGRHQQDSWICARRARGSERALFQDNNGKWAERYWRRQMKLCLINTLFCSEDEDSGTLWGKQRTRAKKLSLNAHVSWLGQHWEEEAWTEIKIWARAYESTTALDHLRIEQKSIENVETILRCQQ